LGSFLQFWYRLMDDLAHIQIQVRLNKNALAGLQCTLSDNSMEPLKGGLIVTRHPRASSMFLHRGRNEMAITEPVPLPHRRNAEPGNPLDRCFGGVFTRRRGLGIPLLAQLSAIVEESRTTLLDPRGICKVGLLEFNARPFSSSELSQRAGSFSRNQARNAQDGNFARGSETLWGQRTS
jgi:hypothetical protein